MAEAVWRFRTE